MNIYKVKYDEFEKRKLDIVNEEKLFDLKISNFQLLINLDYKLNDLLNIYKLYINERKINDNWSKILWKDLNIKLFNKDICDINKKFKQLPDHIKQLNPAKLFKKILNNYMEMIPLLYELKHETVKERHWSVLMEKTNEYFNLSHDYFNLENLFSMQIYKYKNEIIDLVNGAIREENIEKSINSIEDLLNNLKLDINIYKISKKGERYYIFNSLQKIINLLEEQSMNLQSVSSSKYAYPFLNKINNLEKDLMHLSEILDVR